MIRLCYIYTDKGKHRETYGRKTAGLRETKTAGLPEENMTEDSKKMMKWTIAIALLGILFVIMYSTMNGGLAEQLLS